MVRICCGATPRTLITPPAEPWHLHSQSQLSAAGVGTKSARGTLRNARGLPRPRNSKVRGDCIWRNIMRGACALPARRSKKRGWLSLPPWNHPKL